MSTISISDVEYMTRESLASTFTPSSSSPTDTTATARRLPSGTAIIDVRDSDHIGGHIRGSTWVPSSQLDYKIPELLRTLKDKDTVVFHCALSQQRGPSAALRYMREKERLDVGSASEVVSKGVVKEEGEGVEKERADAGVQKSAEGKKQKVVVLQGGFTMWQERYGEDKDLTEGYKKDIWAFGS